jgi:hypothetical protein
VDGKINPSKGLYLQRMKKTKKKCMQTSIPSVGFKHIPMFKQSKTGHISDHMATALGCKTLKWLFSEGINTQIV